MELTKKSRKRIGMSKTSNPTTTRTRTRTRRGGDIVKTKTVTKGDGMKRVEKTKTKNDAFGPYTERSMVEKGPMGKRSMVSWSGSYPEGDGYSFNLQRSKIGGRKTKMETISDFDGTQSKYKEKGKGYKTKTVKITEPGGRSYIKKKGRGSRIAMKKVYKPTIKEQKI
jgi:hypothetical protein